RGRLGNGGRRHGRRPIAEKLRRNGGRERRNQQQAQHRRQTPTPLPPQPLPAQHHDRCFSPKTRQIQASIRYFAPPLASHLPVTPTLRRGLVTIPAGKPCINQVSRQFWRDSLARNSLPLP